jgi:hypothetical protein
MGLTRRGEDRAMTTRTVAKIDQEIDNNHAKLICRHPITDIHSAAEW